MAEARIFEKQEKPLIETYRYEQLKLTTIDKKVEGLVSTKL